MKITQNDIFKIARSQLLEYGYDYLTFTTLSSELGVTRAALYKYYGNKDELIIDLMNEEMSIFLSEIQYIIESEKDKFLLRKILKKMSQLSTLHKLLESVFRIDYKAQIKYKEKMVSLQSSHILLEQYLDKVIVFFKEEKIFSEEIPNEFILNLLSSLVNVLEANDTDARLDLLENVLLNGLGSK